MFLGSVTCQNYYVVIVTTSYFVIVIDICNTIVYGSLGASLISSTPALLIFSCLLNSSQHTQDRPSILNNPIRLSTKSTFVSVSRVLMQGSRGRHDFKYYHHIKSGRTWQPFVGSKNGNENFCQTRFYNFRVKCVVFARNRKFAKLTQ